MEIIIKLLFSRGCTRVITNAASEQDGKREGRRYRINFPYSSAKNPRVLDWQDIHKSPIVDMCAKERKRIRSRESKSFQFNLISLEYAKDFAYVAIFRETSPYADACTTSVRGLVTRTAIPMMIPKCSVDLIVARAIRLVQVKEIIVPWRQKEWPREDKWWNG